MAMGKRSKSSQEALWVEAARLPRSPGHPFYERLNAVLDEDGFDAFVESVCTRYYSAIGRRSIAPGTYFRLLMIGFFEGIDSERGIAWRVSDSLSLRRFLGLELGSSPPDHSTISRTRRLIDVETHDEIFGWILELLARRGLVDGRTVGVDSTTLEANAALRSIVRRDSGEGYQAFLEELARKSGIETPTRGDLAKLDRKRAKKGSNEEWRHPHDPDAKITKMKDGRTHLAHKVEHAVDMKTGAILGVTVQGADRGDTQTIEETLADVSENLQGVQDDDEASAQLDEKPMREIVADKGYHSNAVLESLNGEDSRTYISEPNRGRRNWRGKQEAKKATYANRRRIRGKRGKKILRRRGEVLERSFAHSYDTGGLRRTHLRGHVNIRKRLVLHLGAFNLSLVMRRLVGAGTPRGFQSRLRALLLSIFEHLAPLEPLRRAIDGFLDEMRPFLGTVDTEIEPTAQPISCR